MTSRAIAHARLRNSHLVGEPLATPVDVVRWFGAVQSQDVPGALWALAERLPPGATSASLGAAFDAGAFVRTHGPRPTWHFLAPEELRWIESLVGPRVQRANEVVARRRMDLDRAAFGRGTAVIRHALAGGRALTRPELKTVLVEAGLPFRDPNTIAYLVMDAELSAVVCSGPRRGRQFTYQLVDERIAPEPPRSRDDALRDLTIRYFTSHGPATVHDMSWWSGLTVTDVRRGVELGSGALEARQIDGRAYVGAIGALDPSEGLVPEPFVRLLSNYDEYLGSYVDYTPVYDDALPRPRNVADVLGAHIVIRDGLVVGGWRRALTERNATVTVTLLADLSNGERRALEAEVAAYEAFLEVPVALRYAEP